MILDLLIAIWIHVNFENVQNVKLVAAGGWGYERSMWVRWETEKVNGVRAYPQTIPGSNPVNTNGAWEEKLAYFACPKTLL